MHEVNAVLKRKLNSMVDTSKSVGPERYEAHLLIHGRDPKKVMDDKLIEVMRDGRQLRVITTSSVRNFKVLDVREIDAYLVSKAGTYKLSKGGGTAFFALWRAKPSTPIEDKVTLAKEMGTGFHFQSNHAIPNWFVDWIIRPALKGTDGFTLERFAVNKSRMATTSN